MYLTTPGRVTNCTIYNCTAGMYDNDFTQGVVVLNNAIDNCAVGYRSNSAGTVALTYLIDYNNWSNNTMDMSWNNGSSEDNSAKGPNDTANSPSFTNAAAGDFSLGSTSDLIDAGFSTELGIS